MVLKKKKKEEEEEEEEEEDTKPKEEKKKRFEVMSVPSEFTEKIIDHETDTAKTLLEAVCDLKNEFVEVKKAVA